MDLKANEKRREQDRLMAEAAALEATREEIRKKEDEREKRKQNGYKRHLFCNGCFWQNNLIFQRFLDQTTFGKIETAFERSDR